MSTLFLPRTTIVLGGLLIGCLGEPAPEPGAEKHDDARVRPIAGPEDGPVAAVSVASVDRAPRDLVTLDATWPVEARLLVFSANGTESELGAMRSVLDHRGVPYEV